MEPKINGISDEQVVALFRDFFTTQNELQERLQQGAPDGGHFEHYTLASEAMTYFKHLFTA